jgi:hypothetical protein
MDASLRAVLTESERLLIDETDRAALAVLDEDAAIDLEARIRRARGKYPASEKERAGTLATGARRQARRDSKRAAAR